VGETPLERLRQMNPSAVNLYRTQGIDLAVEMLGVAVSAQHNNGGLAADRWWRSENIRHLYPVGEVNGSHGVKRPGGSALNAGQVGGFRIAEYIAHSRYAEAQQPITHTHQQAAQAMLTKLQSWLALPGVTDANTAMAEIRARMSDCNGILRHAGQLQQAVDESCELLQSILQNGVVACSIRDQLYLRQAAATSLLYLDAVRFQAEAGVGSRGSYLMLADTGESLHPALPQSWRKTAENVLFRSQVLVSWLDENQQPRHRWEACRPVPQPEHWFERNWADFRDGKVFGEDSGTVSSS
jgi:aspartate oxidase